MKYGFICILLWMSIFFTWCNQLINQKQQINTGEQVVSTISIESWQTQFIKSDLYSWTHMGGIHTPPILISGNIIVVSWGFSISIPKEIVHKEYSSQYTPMNKSYYESVSFNNKDNSKTFSFHIAKLSQSEITYIDKDLCKVEYFDWYVTKSEKIKNIQGRNIYIYYATIMANGLDVKPTKIIDTQFCFVDNGILYKFYASNYSHIYMNQIIDSFTFID